MAEEAAEMTAEELELQAKQAAKQRQTEYRKTAKQLKSKKPEEKLEAIEKLSDHRFLSEVRVMHCALVGAVSCGHSSGGRVAPAE